LLVTRVRVAESGMFHDTASKNVQRGNVLMLFKERRFAPYLSSVAIGVPIWYVIGILITFSPEFTSASGSTEVVVAGQGVMWAYVGLAAGDLVSGLVSHWLRSRRRAILLFLLMTSACVAWYLFTPNKTATLTYVMCGALGFCVGYWAVFVTTAAEQFGTNLRATVATTVPNVVRGSLVPAVLLFRALRHQYEGDVFGLQTSALIVGAAVMALAFLGWYYLSETYGKDLDYVEH
jgi:MFS transporter, putative metabolite:H+ symporter